MERCSSVVECRTRNQVSPGSNPALLPFRILGNFVLSIDASRVGVGMNRSAREGKKCKAPLSGPTDWILRYIKLPFFLCIYYSRSSR